ncbi:hypothetical protein BESB_040150 [Besnoitia besnoiti]|uniref:RNA polymerase III RPC4 n=1 Tax=Besnoitia besnoiti TaxID=94643 RepID=A0A2A9MNQ3_BESBE|nr:hypothetical protein BESB_040150 [Besnoitia besnoiti]PFH37557.1 hypothetical protein BESB_040150 [Besnoitia besnoiti]
MQGRRSPSSGSGAAKPRGNSRGSRASRSGRVSASAAHSSSEGRTGGKKTKSWLLDDEAGQDLAAFSAGRVAPPSPEEGLSPIRAPDPCSYSIHQCPPFSPSDGLLTVAGNDQASSPSLALSFSSSLSPRSFVASPPPPLHAFPDGASGSAGGVPPLPIALPEAATFCAVSDAPDVNGGSTVADALRVPASRGDASSGDAPSRAASSTGSSATAQAADEGDAGGARKREGLQRKRLRRIVDDGSSGEEETCDAPAATEEAPESAPSSTWAGAAEAQLRLDNVASCLASGAKSALPPGAAACRPQDAPVASPPPIQGVLPRPVHVFAGGGSGLQRPVASSAAGGCVGAGLNGRGGSPLPAGMMPSDMLQSVLPAPGTGRGRGHVGPSSLLRSSWRGLQPETANGRGRASVRFTPNIGRATASSSGAAERSTRGLDSKCGEKPRAGVAASGSLGDRHETADKFAWTGMIVSSQQRQENSLRAKKGSAEGQGSRDSRTKSPASAAARGSASASAQAGGTAASTVAGGDTSGAAGLASEAPGRKSQVPVEKDAEAKSCILGGRAPDFAPAGIKRDERSDDDEPETDSDAVFDSKTGWKREFGDELVGGTHTREPDGAYLPMSLPLKKRKKQFPRPSPAAALMAADASAHFQDNLDSSAAPGFASFLLLQLPRCLPPLDKEAMRREQLRHDASQQADSGSAPGTGAANSHGSSGVLPRGAAPAAEEPVTLKELPEGALGRLLIHKSGRVVWHLGGDPESADMTSKRRMRQRRDFPVCPWEVNPAQGTQRRQREKRPKGTGHQSTETQRNHSRGQNAGHEEDGAEMTGAQAADAIKRNGKRSRAPKPEVSSTLEGDGRRRLRRGSTEGKSDADENEADERLRRGGSDCGSASEGAAQQAKGSRRLRRVDSSDSEDGEERHAGERRIDADGTSGKGLAYSECEKREKCKLKQEVQAGDTPRRTCHGLFSEADRRRHTEGAVQDRRSSDAAQQSTTGRLQKRQERGKTNAQAGSEQEANDGYCFKIDAGCDCIFKQECGVMFRDNKEFVFLGSCPRRFVVAPHIEQLLHASAAARATAAGGKDPTAGP